MSLFEDTTETYTYQVRLLCFVNMCMTWYVNSHKIRFVSPNIFRVYKKPMFYMGIAQFTPSFDGCAATLDYLAEAALDQ